MTIEYKDSKRITALSTDWTADVTSNITWSTTGKVGWNISGTTISRTGSTGWSTSKIQSTDTFTVGDGLFMIEFSGNMGATMLGFNKGTLGYYYGGGSPSNSADFSIYMAGGDLVEVYESGSKNYGSGGTRSNASDRYRIEVSNSGVVKYYYQAGGTGSFVLKYTSSITASGTYFIQSNAYGNTATATVHSKTVTTAVAKPSDVQDNSLLVEKDAARRYWRTGRGADTTSSQSSFNNDSKIENGASQYDFSGQQFLSGHSLIGKSVSSISFWLWNIGSGSTSGATYSFGVFDSNGNLKGSVFGTNNVSDITQASSYSGATKRTMTTSTPVTIEANDIIAVRTNQALTSTAYDIEIGSGGNGSIEDNARRARGSANNVTEDDNRDVAYEVIQATPATWTMNPTHEIDLSSSTGWTQVTNTNSEVTGGELIGLVNSSSTNGDGIWKDSGISFSDTAFIFRCKFQIVAGGGGSGNANTLYFGISDTNGATSPHSARDGFAIAITNYAAAGMLWNYPSGSTWDNADTDLSLTPSATTYYLEIKRTSPTSVTFTFYDDSGFSSVVKTHTQTIASTLNGLKYILVQTWRNNSNNTTKIAVSNMQVWNGVGSIH
jgi:hypothetical protein